MEKEMIVSSTGNTVEVALLEDGALVEIHRQRSTDQFTVGDVFVGQVTRVTAPLNAAFVDIGHKKDAFLHYTDLGPKVRSLQKFAKTTAAGKNPTAQLDNFVMEPEIVKTGKIDEVFKKKDIIMTQVLKEPISTKGPRLSCEITIPGRFLVMTPFNDSVAVSKKISTSEERKRLHVLIESIRPKNFGVIVRTAAEGKGVSELLEEVEILTAKWETIYEAAKTAKAPAKLLSEVDKTTGLLRDLLTPDFSRIVVDDKDLFETVRKYVTEISPKKANIVQLHKGPKPIFDHYSITKQIKSSFGKTATMPSGAYIVIEHTEAMHTIDVNSGNKMPSQNQAEAVLKINMEAAEEIARQLRLRDIGGIIVIDFIDMRDAEHRKEVASAMRKAMKNDRAQHTVLPLSKFGLMQITRQRVRPEVKITTAEKCPTCNGTGKINATILLTDDIERDLNFIMEARPKAKLKLKVHPYVAAYLKRGMPSTQMKWYLKYYRWLQIVQDGDFPITTYKFFDADDEEIKMS
ncbi:Rne/Rng family ribonuclease [Neolewinella lacunae]|uniref:Rne/Rng family ribonuclease n=1 Tax=Neolewinella lacunae TaxID=1517758 RepID=A0A923PQB5_9BACT|nr:Rne/Rng family ribonuclease [Neolewinella lacunae]MBC6995478.1 Rne/Rng family ribonuclease [Neolewinella lacunae]MDN3635066.1 Rne/Rng family ribonuclease [Neolewinella lacunae]